MSFIKSIKKQKKFTLSETLLVVAILAIVAGIVIIAVNPGRNLGDTRNSQRLTDVNDILNAVYEYSLDNNGSLPPSITTAATEICATGSASCTNLVDLSVVTSSKKGITTMPKDPQCNTTCATNGTGYKILKTTNGRITVSAPAAEPAGTKTISVTR